MLVASLSPASVRDPASWDYGGEWPQRTQGVVCAHQWVHLHTPVHTGSHRNHTPNVEVNSINRKQSLRNSVTVSDTIVMISF